MKALSISVQKWSFSSPSIRLGKWVDDQMTLCKKYKEGKAAVITNERVAQLNSIGFEWRLREPTADSDTWQHRFGLLRESLSEHFHDV
jgi:hypothetical protein